ncbi:MAG TPA: pre-16S rRNA-processing nuclease YqgF [Candidatus Binatia bacterium]|nr:pre-16S rRNA-processing nuclease YqgF [Candidatus Binatia bacterium]
MPGPVLGIDPGTRKCGFAVVAEPGAVPLAMGIEPVETLPERVALLVAAHAPSAIALGAGTNGATVARVLAATGIPIHITDEIETTLRARARYFADHPPRGWRWFVPRGMLLPPRPIDDYAALLIAERFLSSGI